MLIISCRHFSLILIHPKHKGLNDCVNTNNVSISRLFFLFYVKIMAYQTITSIFQRNDSDLTASEAHGLATGMLCIEDKIDLANWLRELFADDILLVEEDRGVLEELFEQTRKLLNNEDESFGFDLFLPNEDGLLREQLEAIGQWCEGFLFGVGFAQSSSDWPGETGEIMKDMVEFTKLDSDVDDDMLQDEADEYEQSVIEIQEYIRVAIMTVKDQFSADQHSQQTH